MVNPNKMERSKIADTFGQQLCQILKLNPDKIKTITITVKPDSVLVVTEEILLDNDAKDVLRALEYYHLVKVVNGNIKNKIVS